MTHNLALRQGDFAELSSNLVAAHTPAYQKLKSALTSRDPKVRAMVKRHNDALIAKAFTPGSVHTDSALSSLSVQYANGAYIGERLMPAINTDKLSGVFYKYDKRARLAYPDDELGARGSPNELNQAVTTDTYSCKGYGYKEYVDNLTIANQDAPLDALADATQNVNEGIAFRRELRIATILTTSGNYSGNTTAVAAGSAWNSAGGGDPIANIQAARAALWSGRGSSKLVAFTTLNVINVLMRHQAFLDIFKYTSSGLVPSSAIANWLGIDEILVTEARKDTANEAQTASYSRIWPDVFGLIRVATAPSIRNAAFGYTFRMGPPDTAQWYDQSLGPKGGYYTRVSVLEDHKVVSPDTGFLLTGVIV